MFLCRRLTMALCGIFITKYCFDATKSPLLRVNTVCLLPCLQPTPILAMDSQPEGGPFVPEEPRMNADWKPISWSSLELFNNLAYTRSTSLAVRNQLIAAQLMNDIECISSYFLHKNKGLTLLKSWFLHRKLTWCQILMGWLENICQMYLFSKIFLTSTLIFVNEIVKLLWRKLSGELDSTDQVHICHLPRKSSWDVNLVDRLSRARSTTENNKRLLRSFPKPSLPICLIEWMKNPSEDWDLVLKLLDHVKCATRNLLIK